MPQPIVRLYDSEETATAVSQELQTAGFSPESMQIIGPSHATPTANGAPADGVQEAIVKAGVAPEHAPIYAEAVHRGQALVVLNPRFGYARSATGILDSHHPVEATLPEAPSAVAAAPDPATPLSS